MKMSFILPHCEDFYGLQSTLRCLINYHEKDFDDIIVVDNPPAGFESKHSKTVQEHVMRCPEYVRYIRMEGKNSTALAKQTGIQNAKNNWIVCSDCHCTFFPTSFETIKTLARKENEKNLYHGPIMRDDNEIMADKWNRVWSNKMLGQYGKLETRSHITEIEAFGMGMFFCNKNLFPVFPIEYEGFGAEEFVIHDIVRLRGGKVYSVEDFVYYHRFLHPDRDNNSEHKMRSVGLVENTIRNYYLGFTLAKNYDEIERMKEHFIQEKINFELQEYNRKTNRNHKQLPESESKKIDDYKKRLDYICSKDFKMSELNSIGNCSGCGSTVETSKFDSLEKWYVHAKETKSDFNEHVETVSKYTKDKIVADCGHSHSTASVGMLYGQPKLYYKIWPMPNSDIVELQKFANGRLQYRNNVSFDVPIDIKSSGVDVLFLDAVHTYQSVKMELEAWAKYVREYIIFHDTEIFGAVGEDGKEGILFAIQEFLRINMKEWSILENNKNNNGLIVITKKPEDKPKFPSTGKQAYNFIKSLGNHILNQGKLVDEAIYEERLNHCIMCEDMKEARCIHCGCFVDLKTSLEISECPHPTNKRWHRFSLPLLEEKKTN